MPTKDELRQQRERREREKLAARLKELFDVWCALKDGIEAEVAAWDAFTKALQGTFNERKKAFDEKLAAWSAVILKVERKRYNVEAKQRGRTKVPFPDAAVPTDDLLRQARQAVIEIKAQAEARGTPASPPDAATRDRMGAAVRGLLTVLRAEVEADALLLQTAEDVEDAKATPEDDESAASAPDDADGSTPPPSGA